MTAERLGRDSTAAGAGCQGKIWCARKKAHGGGGAGRSGCLIRLTVDGIAEHLTGLKTDGTARGDADGFIRRAGVATHLRGNIFNEKGPEIAQHNPVTFHQSLGDVIDRLLNDLEYICLADGSTHLSEDSVHQLVFGNRFLHDSMWERM